MDSELRRAVLLRGAMEVAESLGIRCLTHARVADACGCSTRTVYRWSRSRKVLRERVAAHAARCGCLRIAQEYEKLMGERVGADA